MSADLALQKALRAVLVASPAVVALVPEAQIFDRHARPVAADCIALGEVQELEGTAAKGDHVTLFHTLHIWKMETSMQGAKRIGHAVRVAIRAGRVALENGYHLGGWRVTQARYMRDPGGEFTHGIITIQAEIGGGDL